MAHSFLGEKQMETSSSSSTFVTGTRSISNPSVLIVAEPNIHSRIEFMKGLQKRFDLTAIGPDSNLRLAFQRSGLPYDTYSLSRKFNPVSDMRTLASLVRLFRRHRPDVVHAFTTKPSVFGRLAASIAGVPVVIGTVTGLGSLYVDNNLATRTARATYERLQKLACRFSDLTIFQNHDDAARFIDGGIVTEDKAIVIPGSGVRTDLFNPARFTQSDRDSTRRRLGVRPDALLITMISRLLRTKGVLEFASAARIVREQHPNVDFLLVGPTDEDSIDRLTPDEISQVTRSLTWAGPLDDIAAILATSDVCVLPSYREGIPRVLLEATSMGLPVVTTDTPGCNEVVRHGTNGLLTPARDHRAVAGAITEMAENPERRLLFGRNSRRHAIKNFDLSKIVDEISSIYWDLLERKGLKTPAYDEVVDHDVAGIGSGSGCEWTGRGD